MYGGSDRGIYTKVMTAAPKCGLTFAKFKEAINNYMKAHPEYVEWVKEVQQLATEKRISVNAFGRVRTLMGEANKILRQALNSPVQGSAAEVARSCMPMILDYIDAKGWQDDVKLVLQVHDEYVVEYPIKMRKEVAQMMKDVMTAPININGHTINLKIDIEVGKYWGGMNKYDLDRDEVIVQSKH